MKEPTPPAILRGVERPASALTIAASVATGDRRAADVIEEALDRAERVQQATNAFTFVAAEAARARASEVDRRVAAGERLPLAGVPVVIKDNICTAGMRTTAGSSVLSGFVPPYSATVVERLEAAGAVVVAKANCDEFGMGSSNEHSAFGPVRNPWDPARVPGGSSGGSAVAVAAGVAPLALGTDTGGSVRQPASFTGVMGYKPTYGVLSRYGVISYASSLDQVGVLARSEGDIRLAMSSMMGRDPRDATTVDAAALQRAAGVHAAGDGDRLEGLRIGIVQELSGEGNAPGVLAALERMAEAMAAAGASLQQVSLPHAQYGVPTYYLVATAEASSNLARYDGTLYGSRIGEDASGQEAVARRTRGHGFGPEVQRRVLMGTFALSAGSRHAYYDKAMRVRRVIADEFARAFEEVDLLLTPTAPTVAFRIGERMDDPLSMYVGDVDSCLANLVGVGALSIPAGEGELGLPCGVQLVAPALRDDRLWSVARALESAAGSGFAPPPPAAA